MGMKTLGHANTHNMHKSYTTIMNIIKHQRSNLFSSFYPLELRQHQLNQPKHKNQQIKKQIR